MKKETIGGRVDAEFKELITQEAEKQGVSVSIVLENIIKQHFNTEPNPELENAIQAIESQKQEIERYKNECIILNIKKIPTNVLGMWLEIKSKASKQKTHEDTLIRVYTLFTRAYGNVEEEFVKEAQNIKLLIEKK